MFVRKSLLLASIAAFGVSVATAQQAGVSPIQVQGAQLSDPFAAPPAAAASGFSVSPAPLPQTPEMMQAQVEALAFGSPIAGTASMDAAPVAAAPAPAAYAAQPMAAAPAPMPLPAAAFPAPGAASASLGFDIGTPAPVAPPMPAANPFQAPVAAAQPAAVARPGTAAFSIEAANPENAAKEKSPTDETALRYYASQRDLVRVGAEIRRLKTLYPDWQAPGDLFAPRGGADEQPLWDLYAKGDYAAVRRAIDAVKTTKPNWTPSQDLMTKIEDGETRQNVKAAAASGNWTGAIAAAQLRPSILVCANMDVLWTVGEGFARSGNMARAFDLYAYILGNCDVPGERLATFQKATELLPPQGVDALASYGRILASGQNEFAGMRFDRLRKEMADIASGKSASTPPVEELKAYADYVRSSHSANDMGLVGWYFYGQEEWDRSAEWFRAGMEAGGDAKLIEGYVLSLRNAEKIAEAEAIAYKTYKQSPELAKIYVELVSDELTSDESSKPIEKDLVERFEDVVKDTKSPLGAQALGWRLTHDEEFEEAQEWFARSVEWNPTEEGVVGLAVVASRLKQNAEVKAIKAKYQDDFPVLADFKEYVPVASTSRRSREAAATGTRSSSAGKKGGAKKGGGGDALMAEANRRFQSGDYEGALDALDQREARRGKEYGAELLRGWTNHKLKRWDTARKVFAEQDKKRSTKDTRFGIGATSNSQYGMWSERENKCKEWGKC